MKDENQLKFGFAERWWERYIVTLKTDISQTQIDAFRYMYNASIDDKKTEFRTPIDENGRSVLSMEMESTRTKHSKNK
jgi:hypothetical protein